MMSSWYGVVEEVEGCGLVRIIGFQKMRLMYRTGSVCLYVFGELLIHSLLALNVKFVLLFISINQHRLKRFSEAVTPHLPQKCPHIWPLLSGVMLQNMPLLIPDLISMALEWNSGSTNTS